jgi:hypothetical protein
MEVAVLGGLVSVAYATSRFFDKKKGAPVAKKGPSGYLAPMRVEGFAANGANSANEGPIRPGVGSIPNGFPTGTNSGASAARGPNTNPLTLREKGASALGFAPELDLMYKNPNGQTYPSEPNTPAPHGNAFGYATERPPIAPAPTEWGLPRQEPLDTQAAMVEMRSDGIEESPTYVEGKFVMSPLSGQKIPAEQFRHNNMMPFFGGRVKQNIGPQTNNSLLDTYTGSGATQIQKREVEAMFDTAKTPYGNPFGMEDNTDFFQSRINDPRSRGGERPFEPVRVAPGVDTGYGTLGKGGFQQFEVNEIMMKAMPTTDKLRVADKPKISYDAPVVPGKHFVSMPADNAGEVRKQRPDTYYTNENGERNFVTNGEYIAETTRPTQILNYAARPETTTDRIVGPATSQEFNETYVTGSYRTPMTQQYGGAGYRNANATNYYTKDVDAAEADYGKSAIEIRPNERMQTGERTMGLNVAPADTGLVTVHYDDNARPTYRAETVGNIRQTGTPVGYAGGAPSVTVWDPSDIARTTVKEGTVDWDYRGVASSGDAPNKLKVYDPDDVARPTQKAQLSAALSYVGPGDSSRKNFTSHDAAYNMRLNPNKDQVSKLRKPVAGNGVIMGGTLNGNIYQTTKKLDTDSINDRTNAVNRVVELPTGSADIGRVKFRVPPQLDIAGQRNTPEMVAAVESNPLNQSLRLNAMADARLLKEMGFGASA